MMQQFNKFKEFNFRIRQGEVESDLKGMMISIANASQFGNNAKIAPEADTNDGKANITMVRKMKLLQLPYFAYKVFDGTIAHSSFAQLVKSEKVTITCENEMPLHVDGEVAGFATSFEITAHKSTLRLIIP
ncbi:MAG: hypothetical protein IPP71_19265 [Bacteroidetes bacterium]|nr:hypothetical protein [Bacteroidota bacterium]